MEVTLDNRNYDQKEALSGDLARVEDRGDGEDAAGAGQEDAVKHSLEPSSRLNSGHFKILPTRHMQRLTNIG